MADEPSKKKRKFGEVTLSAYIVLAVGGVLVLLAFSTPNWLSSDERLYGHKFVKLGLWEQCFRSITITLPEHNYDQTYFMGCRWLFTPWTADYDRFRDDVILQPFFIAVQVLFTLCMICVMIGCVLIVMYGVCFGAENHRILFVTSMVLLVSAIFGTIAVIIFGARGDGRDWMPDPDHNYLSWSFGLAVVGSYFMWVASLLFFIQSRRIRKEEENGGQNMYGMPGHSKA